MKKIPILTLAATVLFTACSIAIASDLSKKCDKCHGKNGNSTDSKVASIAGFSTSVLHDILHEFKDGDRAAVKYKPKDGKKTDMKEITDKLSDKQINEIALHYCNQSFIPRKQPFDEKLAKKGKKLHKRKCEKCHSDGGTKADDDAAILAGQGRKYLEEQFHLIHTHDRIVPKKMWHKFKHLKDKQIKELTEYYISEQNGKPIVNDADTCNPDN